MKALNIFKIVFFAAMTITASHSMAQSCYLADDGGTRVSDRSISSQKRLWESCIDRKLAQLDPRHPNYFEMGQRIGDICTSSQIICE